MKRLSLALLAFALTLGLAQAAADKDAPTDPFATVRTDLAAGAWRRAEIALKGHLQVDPDDPSARRLLADLYLLRRQGAAAQQELERAAALEPRGPESPVPLGLALLYQNQPQALLDQIDAPTDAPPALAADILALRGLAQGVLNDYEAARQSLDAALAQDKNNPRALLGLARLAGERQDLEAARRLVGQVLERQPASLDGLELLADLESRAGDPPATIEALDRMVKAAPEFWPARLRRAKLRLDLREVDSAAADLKTLTAQIPGAPDLALLRGRLALLRGEVQAGLEQLEGYLGTQRSDPVALYLAGAAAYQLGQQGQAEDYANRLARVAPGSVESIALLAAIRLATGDTDGAGKLLGRLPADTKSPLVAELRLRSAVIGGDLAGAETMLDQRIAAGDATRQDRLRRLRLLATRKDWPGVARDARLLLDIDRQASAGEAAIPASAENPNDGALIEGLLIESLVQTGDLPGALEQARDRVAQRPQDTAAHTALGYVLARQGDRAAARAAYQEALAIDPANTAAALHLAGLEADGGDLPAARTALERLVAAAPEDPRAILSLAALDTKEGRPAEAKARLTEALARIPDSLGLRLSLVERLAQGGDDQGALRLLQDAPAGQGETPPLLRLRGELELRTKQHAQAVDTFERLRRLRPTEPAPALLLALAKAESGQTMGIETLVVEAVGLADDQSQVQGTLDAVYQRLPDDAARERLVRALGERHPEHPDYHRLAAQLAVAAEDPTTAIVHLRAAHKAAPDRPGIYQALVALLIAEGDTQDALAISRRWVERHPKDEGARLALAGLQLREQDTGAAIASYRAVLAENPRQPVALNNLANLTMEQDLDAALAMARQAVALAPGDWRMADTLAMLLLRSGQGGEAAALLGPLREAAPGNPNLSYRLAAALADSGDKKSALRLLREIGPRPFDERAAADVLMTRLQTELAPE